MKKFLSLIILLLVIMICGVSLAKTENNNPLLENIKIDGLNIDFDYMKTEYVLTVPDAMEEVNIQAVPQDKKATVTIIGDSKLKTGVNKFEIQVTAEDKIAKQSYFLSITKGNEEKANANLKKLEIANSTIAPYFQKDTIEYVVEYPSNQNILDIVALPEKQNAKVDIQGNKDLTQTVQKITITVTAENGVTKKNYTIIAKKQGQVVEDPSGGEVTSKQNTKQNVIKINLLIIVIILIIIIITVMLIGKFKSKGRRK